MSSHKEFHMRLFVLNIFVIHFNEVRYEGIYTQHPGVNPGFGPEGGDPIVVISTLK